MSTKEKKKFMINWFIFSCNYTSPASSYSIISCRRRSLTIESKNINNDDLKWPYLTKIKLNFKVIVQLMNQKEPNQLKLKKSIVSIITYILVISLILIYIYWIVRSIQIIILIIEASLSHHATAVLITKLLFLHQIAIASINSDAAILFRFQVLICILHSIISLLL